jgi:hypothetical protein
MIPVTDQKVVFTKEFLDLQKKQQVKKELKALLPSHNPCHPYPYPGQGFWEGTLLVDDSYWSGTEYVIRVCKPGFEDLRERLFIAIIKVDHNGQMPGIEGEKIPVFICLDD